MSKLKKLSGKNIGPRDTGVKMVVGPCTCSVCKTTPACDHVE